MSFSDNGFQYTGQKPRYGWPNNYYGKFYIDQYGPSDNTYIGMNVNYASKIARENGQLLRVVHEDGQDLTVSSDVIPKRINVVVRNGTVVSIYSRG